MSETSTYIAVTSVYETRQKGKPQLRHPGQEIQLDQESAEHLLARGAVREAKAEDEQESAEDEEVYETPVPRPGSNASKDEWRAYAASLPGGGPDLPAEAKRDEIIAAVDAYDGP